MNFMNTISNAVKVSSPLAYVAGTAAGKGMKNAFKANPFGTFATIATGGLALPFVLAAEGLENVFSKSTAKGAGQISEQMQRILEMQKRGKKMFDEPKPSRNLIFPKKDIGDTPLGPGGYRSEPIS
jgi:hypothetical protein